MHAGLFLLLAVAFLGTACSNRQAVARIDESGPPVRGGTLEVVGLSDVDHWATTSASFASAYWLFSTFARQLLTFPTILAGDNSEIVPLEPDLALEVPTIENGGITADGRVYTFHIRRGVRWNSSPPREVTAHDIVRGFRLLCNPAVPAFALRSISSTIAGMARYCDDFARVAPTAKTMREFINMHDFEGVRAVDDSTVVFSLLTPAADFAYLVALPYASAVPAEYLQYLPDSPEFRQHMLSNGPYRVARYVQDREMSLERNPVWDATTDPQRAAYLDRIRLRFGMDVQLQHLEIEAGTADLSFDLQVPSTELATLLSVHDPTVWLFPPGDKYAAHRYIVFNFVGPNVALKQRLVRNAIALAVDKNALVRMVGGYAVARALRQAVPSSMTGFVDDADRFVTPGDRGDPTAARGLLAEAGYPRGMTLKLAYVTSDSLLAQVLQASLGRTGLEIHLMPLTPADLYGRLMSDTEHARRGDWDLALFSITGPDWFGENNGRSFAMTQFDSRQSTSMNPGGYSNREVDALFDRATSAPSVDLAKRAWLDAARLLMEDVALVPLVEKKLAFARSSRVRNCRSNGWNCDPTTVWLADATR